MDAADKESARPDFAMAIYPGHLATGDDKLNRNVPVFRETPPTFLVQAEDDHTDGVHQSLVYYAALANAGVPDASLIAGEARIHRGGARFFQRIGRTP